MVRLIFPDQLTIYKYFQKVISENDNKKLYITNTYPNDLVVNQIACNNLNYKVNHILRHQPVNSLFGVSYLQNIIPLPSSELLDCESIDYCLKIGKQRITNYLNFIKLPLVVLIFLILILNIFMTTMHFTVLIM